MRQRTAVIVCTTFFPAPVVSSVRVTNWARMLCDRGWRVTILCRYYGYDATRRSIEEGVHRNVDVEYLDGPYAGRDIPEGAAERPSSSPSLRATLGAALKNAITESSFSRLFVADPSIFFWRSIRSRVLETCIAREADVLITTSPSHSIHSVGLHCSQHLPWVADFRDAYLIDPRYQPRGIGRLAYGAHLRFEASIYQRASRVLHAMPLHARFSRRRYPEARCIALTHPIPEDLATGEVEPEPSTLPSVRVIGVIGNDEALALAHAVRAASERLAKPIELRIVGPVPGSAPGIRELLGERAVLTGALRHDLAKRQIAGADVFVSFLSETRSRYFGVSSKLFEFAAVGRPIIEINPTRPDRQLLRKLPGVFSLLRPSVDELSAAIERALAPQAAEAARRGAKAERFRREHSWRAHADALEDALEGAIRDWATPASRPNSSASTRGADRLRAPGPESRA